MASFMALGYGDFYLLWIFNFSICNCYLQKAHILATILVNNYICFSNAIFFQALLELLKTVKSFLSSMDVKYTLIGHHPPPNKQIKHAKMLISFTLATNQICSWLIIRCVFLKVIQVFKKNVVTLIRFGDFKKIILKTRKICVHISLQLKQY